MGQSVGWYVGSKFGSAGRIIVDGEEYYFGRRERTLLYSVNSYNIYDHPETLMGVFEPTSDRWVERVWEASM